MSFLTGAIIAGGLVMMYMTDEKTIKKREEKKKRKKIELRNEEIRNKRREEGKREAEALRKIEEMKQIERRNIMNGRKIKTFKATEPLIETQIEYLNDELTIYYNKNEKQNINQEIKRKIIKLNEVIMKTENETSQVRKKVEERIWLEISNIKKMLEEEEEKKAEMIIRKLDEKGGF